MISKATDNPTIVLADITDPTFLFILLLIAAKAVIAAPSATITPTDVNKRSLSILDMMNNAAANTAMDSAIFSIALAFFSVAPAFMLLENASKAPLMFSNGLENISKAPESFFIPLIIPIPTAIVSIPPTSMLLRISLIFSPNAFTPVRKSPNAVSGVANDAFTLLLKLLNVV